MKKVSILELYRKTRNANEPLFGDVADLEGFEFMAGYLQKYGRIDRNFAKTHAHWCPLWNTNYEEDASAVLEAFREDVTDLITKNANDYQRLWDALVEATYNPVENYDRFEEIINDFGATRRVDNIGATRRTNAFGATQRTNAYGAQTETNSIGAQNNSTTFGAKSETENIGARSDSATHYMQGFNSTNPNETNSDAMANGAQLNTRGTVAHTDQESFGARSDQTTKNQHSDTISDIAHTDTESEDARINTSADDARRDSVHGHIHGNIGVTSAMDLIKQEVALRVGSRFYDLLFNDIIKELCQLVDESDFGAFSMCLNKKPESLREVASYDEFTMYVDDNSGLYIVYENGAVVPSFTYDQASGNLYIVNRAGFEIHLRFDAETGNLYRLEE